MSEPIRFKDIKFLYTAEDGSHTKLVLKPETTKRVAATLEIEGHLHEGDDLHLIIVHNHEAEAPDPVGQQSPR